MYSRHVGAQFVPGLKLNETRMKTYKIDKIGSKDKQIFKLDTVSELKEEYSI